MINTRVLCSTPATQGFQPVTAEKTTKRKADAKGLITANNMYTLGSAGSQPVTAGEMAYNKARAQGQITKRKAAPLAN